MMDARIGILYEDDALIVCHKKPGIAVQTAATGQADMVSELKKYLAGKAGADPYLGVIHRLDQPVEGILVFAKTGAAAAALSAQADGGSAGDPSRKQAVMKKEYSAIVYGRMPEQQGELTDCLAKDARSNISRVVSAADRNGKRAHLFYQVSEQTPETQTLRIRLTTGRHHQIRVQLAHAGCPILGDTRYGTDAAKQYAAEQGIRRLCLCADRLAFLHPITGEWQQYELGSRDAG